MKIAILGTRGIPNNYGGFEQCAEKLSVRWVKQGHKVTVYNPSDHPYKEKVWYNVKIKHIYSNETKLGIFGTFIYDYLCLKDEIRQDFDVILNLGYVPSALFFYLKKHTKAMFVTNMDGLEWKRSKWNDILRKFIRFCEKLAVEYSDILIADNPGIKDYYLDTYGVNSFYIPYGAELFDNPDDSCLAKLNLRKYTYYMLVARLEPENNIEMILDGYLKSNVKEPFIVVGKYTTKHAKYLLKKYKGLDKVKFVGGIYDYRMLSSLRWFSKIYFHGHSVGGTNPSLLEAMASNAFIAAHDNPFNRYVLGKEGLYFRDSNCVAEIIKNYNFYLEKNRSDYLQKNRKKIKDVYNWDKIANRYLEVFSSFL